MYVYVWLGHFAVQQKLMEQCKATIIKKVKKKKTSQLKQELEGPQSNLGKLLCLNDNT